MPHSFIKPHFHSMAAIFQIAVYFFNPFSIEILRKVLSRIYESYYENPREILLFFYYPSEEYISCLMTEELLLFFDEIDTEDLFEGKNERERIVVFSVGGI